MTIAEGDYVYIRGYESLPFYAEEYDKNHFEECGCGAIDCAGTYHRPWKLRHPLTGETMWYGTTEIKEIEKLPHREG